MQSVLRPLPVLFSAVIASMAGCDAANVSQTVNGTTASLLRGRAAFVTDDSGDATAAWLGTHLVPKIYYGSSFKLNDDTLGKLVQLKKLKALYIADEGVTDAGMEHVAAMRQLEVLDLRWSTVTDRGLERLEALSNLKVLRLANTQVTDAGIERFRRAVPNCDVRE